MTDTACKATNIGRAAVLISGGGTNLQSLIDAATGGLAMQICVVASNNPDAGGLERARRAGISTLTIPNKKFADRLKFDMALADAIDLHSPDFLILAGFMRILSPQFVARYDGRILNIHPSLLPDYPGLDTHQRVLDANEEWHGCTVHFVTGELDGGPPVIQGRVAVLENDSADTLASRVLQVEHRIYPIAAGLMASKRLRCEKGAVFLDGDPLLTPIVYKVAEDHAIP